MGCGGKRRLLVVGFCYCYFVGCYSCGPKQYALVPISSMLFCYCPFPSTYINKSMQKMRDPFLCKLNIVH